MDTAASSERNDISDTSVASHAPATLRVGDKLPKALGTGDMIAAFGISKRTFYRRERAGEFRPFELPRPLGMKRWSGEKVQCFLDGRSH